MKNRLDPERLRHAQDHCVDHLVDRFFHRLSMALMALLPMLIAIPAQTAPIIWTADRSGFWDDPTGWDLGRVPAPGDDVAIKQPPFASPIQVTHRGGVVDSVFSSVEISSSSELRVVNGFLEVVGLHTVEGAVAITEDGHLSVFDTLRNSGTVIVDGRLGFSTLFAERYVGGQDVATLSIVNGARATIETLVSGTGNWSITVDHAELFVGPGGFRQQASGGTSVSDGGVLTVTGIYDITGSTLRLQNATVMSDLIRVSGSGAIDGRGRLQPYTDALAVEVTDGGTLLTPPGEELSIGGDLLCSGGNLVVRIGGTGPGQYGVFDVLGAAIFAGCNISFDFFGGYLPELFDNVEFLLADSITGFDTLTFGLINAFGTFDVAQTLNGLVFVATSRFLPEPGSVWLMIAVMAGIAGTRRSHGTPARPS